MYRRNLYFGDYSPMIWIFKIAWFKKKLLGLCEVYDMCWGFFSFMTERAQPSTQGEFDLNITIKKLNWFRKSWDSSQLFCSDSQGQSWGNEPCPRSREGVHLDARLEVVKHFETMFKGGLFVKKPVWIMLIPTHWVSEVSWQIYICY